jgi:hypothetical protein
MPEFALTSSAFEHAQAMPSATAARATARVGRMSRGWGVMTASSSIATLERPVPALPGRTLQVGGGWTRPPLERSAGSAALFVEPREHGPPSDIFSVSSWRVWLAIVAGVSVLAAIVIYAVSDYTRRHQVPSPTPTPAG